MPLSSLPGSVLFVCANNAVRSPMAEAMLKATHGRRIWVDSAGVRAGTFDPFVAAVLSEIGIERGDHVPKRLDDLEDGFVDLVVTMADEARDRLATYGPAADRVEHWPIVDPTLVEGSRNVRLAAYRAVRDDIARRLEKEFGRGE